MMPICPRCHSATVATRNHVRKSGGAIGAIAGGASSLSRAMKGVQTGYRLGVVAGPADMALGSFAGAILGGLLSGAAGCSNGIALGELIDAKVLDNYRCLECEHVFGHSSTEPAGTSSSPTSASVGAENPWLGPSFDEQSPIEHNL